MIVFSTDHALWNATSRRVVATRPAADGSFSFRNLPPGDYFVAALTRLSQTDTRDPPFLEGIALSALKISLGEGQRLVQDLQVAAARP